MKIQLPQFDKASILIIGDVMLDRYWFGDALRISPEAPVPVVKINQVDERPGGAGNVALNISTLGAKATLLGIVGNDLTAKKLEEQLKIANVFYDLQYIDAIPTITKLRVISRHQQLLRLDFEEKLPDTDTKALLAVYKKKLAESHLVILSDYNKGTLTHVSEFIQLARKAGITVVVDPKGSDFSIYRNANVITPNYKEFEAVVGICKNEAEIVKKGQDLLSKWNMDALLLTRGSHGMSLIQRDKEELHFPAHAREVFDVTGAGDTVIAVFGSAIAAGSSYAEAMILANLAAGLVVSKLGAATVTLAELQAALNLNESITNGGIVDEDELKLAVSESKLQGKRVVFTNGCFDILHAGHVTYLKQAKQLGDYLIVAVNDDASVKRLKGSTRPVNTLLQRMTVLAGLGMVDWVVSYPDDTPIRLLKKLQPDVLVKGGDYTRDQVVGADIVQAYGGDVRVLGVVKNLSTSSILERVIQSQSESNKESVDNG